MKRNKKQPDEDAAMAGVRVLTVSLFIILLAFFIVLNSIAVVDERSQLEALGSLTGSFGILPGGLSPMMGRGQSITPPQSPMMRRDTEQFEVVQGSTPRAGRVFKRNTSDGDVITLEDRVLFDEGSHRIRLSSYAFLQGLCGIVNQHEYPIEITGHTDDRPPDEKSVDSNWELSSLRAVEVLKFFVVIGKVHPSRLTAYGRAGQNPIASNETRETRAINNRVDIAVKPKSLDGLGKILDKARVPSWLLVFKRFVFRIFD